MLTLHYSVLISLTMIHFILMGRLETDSVSFFKPTPWSLSCPVWIAVVHKKKSFFLMIVILVNKILSCGFSWKLKICFFKFFVKNFVLLLRQLGYCLIEPKTFIEEFLYFLLPKLKWWIICELYRNILYPRRIIVIMYIRSWRSLLNKLKEIITNVFWSICSF